MVIHGRHIHLLIHLGVRRRRRAQLKPVVQPVLLNVLVEGGTGGLEELHIIRELGGVSGPLPVDVDAVEAPVSDELDGGGGEEAAPLIGGGGGAERGRRASTPDRQHYFEPALPVLHDEHLPHAAERIRPALLLVR